MCRLAAYLGPETNLKQIVFDTNHSLEKQAWQPQELRESKLNADGFGFAWYNDNGQAARYRQTLPIWSDPNLSDFSNSLQRSLWLCYIRSATTDIGTNLDNTQPFIYQSWQFMHNGYINNFQHDVRGRIRQTLSADLEALIQGSSDSEYLFIFIIHFFKKHNDMQKAIIETFKQLKKWLGKERALFNILLSDGVQIIATSHAINGQCPSLYYGNNINEFPANSQLLVSEKLNDDSNWQTIEEHSLIILRPGKQMECRKL